MSPGTSCHPVFVPVHTCPSFSSLLSHISLISLLPVFFFSSFTDMVYFPALTSSSSFFFSLSHSVLPHSSNFYDSIEWYMSFLWWCFLGWQSEWRPLRNCLARRETSMHVQPSLVFKFTSGACTCCTGFNGICVLLYFFQNTELNDVTCMSQCQTRDKGNHSPPGSCKKKVWTAARVCQLERLCDDFNLYCKYFHVYGACFLEAIM